MSLEPQNMENAVESIEYYKKKIKEYELDLKRANRQIAKPRPVPSTLLLRLLSMREKLSNSLL